ncbi:MAG: hypothetical protein HQK54_03175 [Oligoflexales bacterium]|nr:hypothetical protein [Oligoflexales bacterium]
MRKYTLLNIDGNTRLLGIIGRGIGYTLSPLIHNTASIILGNNCVYLPYDISETWIKPFLDCFWELGGIGLNVTKPYKEIITKYSVGNGSLSSINTLYRGVKGWESSSTDGPGFINGLKRLQFEFSDFGKIIFLGNGGAALGLLEHFVSLEGKRKQITILRKKREKDVVFKKITESSEAFEIKFGSLDPHFLNSELRDSSDTILLIQATSAPLEGQFLSDYANALCKFNGAFIDLVYGTPSLLLPRSRELGIACQDGLPMLVEQARLSESFWWGECAPYEDLLHVVEDHLKKN